ncbi:MAG: Flp pilus assembly complex ATPase component TadA [Proteobacteria bacterium]|nr:Flp pilus assembly complex ATPase component TadA [Pseudomonadota bacterium]
MPDTDIKQHKTTFRLGEILVKEGLATKTDIQKALRIQKEEKQKREIPLGTLLVQKGLITEEQLKTLLNHPYLRKMVGQMALEHGLLNEKQLTECLLKKKENESIGRVLIREGYLKDDDLTTLLNKQSGSTRIGELALKCDMIREEDLRNIVQEQRNLRTIGEILCDMGVILPNELNRILSKYDKKQKIGEILVNNKIITEDQLKKVLHESKNRLDKIGKILIEKKLITVDELYIGLSKQYNIKYEKLDHFTLNNHHLETLTRLVSQNYAKKHGVIPLSLEGVRLKLAVSDAEKLYIAHELSALYPKYQIECVFVSFEKFSKIFTELYKTSIRDTSEEKTTKSQTRAVEFLEIDLHEERHELDNKTNSYGISDMEAIEVVNHIIKYGITNGASDIHIEQDRGGAKLRYRVDGVLQQLREDWLDLKLQSMTGSIISRIKVMSNLDIAERRLPQDGVFRINFLDKTTNKKNDLDFRVAVCPAITGENITIRILDSRKAKVGLENLGHSPHVLEPFKKSLSSAAGMVLVSGPTGSGKSSTLYGALIHIHHPGIKIITAEDPIEYSFPGIMQTQINPKINLTFAKLLRSFLRLDPDVILIGEMRDEDTASIGFDAAQTGHLLLSTIHTNDSVAAVSRLLDLNIEPNQIISGLSGVLAQRLVRRLCPSCSEPYIPSEEEWRMLFHTYPSHLKFHKAKGCDICDFSGYNGRVLISEFFEMEENITRAIVDGATESRLKKIAKANGMKTMLDDCLQKIDMTTLSEIIRVIPHDMIKEFKRNQIESADIPDQTEEVNTALQPEPVPAELEPLKVQKTVIFDPESQEAAIDKMFEYYEKHREKTGKMANWSDAPVFKEFIKDHFHHICGKYKCGRVSFFIEVSDKNIGIRSVPDMTQYRQTLEA